MKLKVTAATVFKHLPRQSSDLPDAEKRSVPEGQEFTLTAQEPAEGNHLKVTLAEPLDDRAVWYVFAPHVQISSAATAPSATSKAASAQDEEDLDVAGAIGCSIFLGLIGLLCLLVPVVQVASADPNSEGRSRLNGWGWTGLAIGLPMTAVGAWYGIDTVLRGRKHQKEKVKNAFYALLEANNGEITLLQFAKAANLSGEEARAYLNERAKEFNATFDVDMNGGVNYHFR